MKLTKQQIEEILESPVTTQIEESAGKHDYHFETYVTKIDDKYYKFTLEYSYNEGLISFDYGDTVEGREVRPVEVKTIEYFEVE